VTRPLLRSVDLLADAAFLALAGETLPGAAHRLGFDTPTTLVAFLHAHRYDRTARRLANNSGDLDPSERLQLVRRLLTDRGNDHDPHHPPTG
jgi:hypothetical protein